MKLWHGVLLVGAIACGSDSDGEEVNENGSGVITFTVDGETYTETKDVTALLSGAFMSMTWNSTTNGDLGEDYYGSLTLSAYTGVGAYTPMRRRSDIDAVIGVATDDGAVTYYPPEGDDGMPGTLEVTEADELGAKGTFGFQGVDAVGDAPPTAITGTFDVVFGIQADEE